MYLTSFFWPVIQPFYMLVDDGRLWIFAASGWCRRFTPTLLMHSGAERTCLVFLQGQMILVLFPLNFKLRRLHSFRREILFGSGDHHWSASMRFRAIGATFGVIIKSVSCLRHPRARGRATFGGGGFDLF